MLGFSVTPHLSPISWNKYIGRYYQKSRIGSSAAITCDREKILETVTKFYRGIYYPDSYDGNLENWVNKVINADKFGEFTESEVAALIFRPKVGKIPVPDAIKNNALKKFNLIQFNLFRVA